MTIDSTELIRILPAMLQGRKKFAKMSDGGNYHIYCGIKAVVIVEGMTYVNEAERREE